MAKRINLNSILQMLRVNNLSALQESERQATDAFLGLWPKGREVLEHFRRRPNCGSCKGNLVELLSEDPGRVKAFLKRLRPDSELELDLADAGKAEPDRPRVVAGEVHDIEDSPGAYAQFLQDLRLRGGRYQGLSVRPLEPGRIRVYFY